MLGPLANAAASDLCCYAPLGADVRRAEGRSREDAERAARAARAVAEDFDGYAALAAAARRADQQPGADAVRAQLRAISLGEETPLPSGTDIPYVRLRERPTLVQAARVFSLSRGQCEAFFLLAEVLERESRGERCEQVRATARARDPAPPSVGRRASD